MAITDYRLPGVFVERARDAGDVALLTGSRIPVIIGRGQRTYLAGDKFVALTDHTEDGIDTFLGASDSAATSIVSVGDAPGQAKYISGVDFTFSGTVSSPTKTIDWSLGTDRQPGKTTNGTTYNGYWIRYKIHIPVAQTTYQVVTDENEILRLYGEESTTNLISVGGRLALLNGAPQVGMVQLDLDGEGGNQYPATDPDNPTEGELRTAFQYALTKLEELEPDQVSLLVPMSVDDNVMSDYLTHVDLMSLASESRWRTLIRGVESMLASTNAQIRDNIITTTQLYQSHSSARRITVVGPGEVQRDISISGVPTTTAFDGSALAAAAAGSITAGANPAITLTRKTLVGLTITTKLSRSDRRLAAAEGATIFYLNGTLLTCNHWLTPDLRDAATQEAAVTQIEDALKYQLEVVLDQQYVGALILSGVLTDISSTVKSNLNLFIELGAIVSYSDLVVTQDTDPRNINISFRVLPAYPVNWIDITFVFDTGVGGIAVS